VEVEDQGGQSQIAERIRRGRREEDNSLSVIISISIIKILIPSNIIIFSLFLL